jgi:plasmid stability protein
MSSPTLHVRNVPTELYEALRAAAEEHGSSIGAEAIRLLRRALRTERAEVRQILDEVEAGRPRTPPGTASAAQLIRKDRDAP